MYEGKFQETFHKYIQQMKLLTWVAMKKTDPNKADKKACNSSRDFWFNEFLYYIQCRYKILPFDDAIWRSNENQSPFGSMRMFVWWLWFCKAMTAAVAMVAHYVCEWARACLKSFAFEICGFDFWVFWRIFNFAQEFTTIHTYTNLNLFLPETFQLCYRSENPFNLLQIFVQLLTSLF